MSKKEKPIDRTPLTLADHEYIEAVRAAEHKLRQQEERVSVTAKKLCGERAEARALQTELRNVARALPLLDGQQ